MAADSRCSEDGRFVTRTHKIFRLSSGALLGSAGDADFRDICRLLDKVKNAKGMPDRAALSALRIDFAGSLALPNGSTWLVDIDREAEGPEIEYIGGIIECQESYAAAGSGSEFAIGAMAHGATAKAAVAIACQYDLNTGPPVRTVPLRRQPKPSKL